MIHKRLAILDTTENGRQPMHSKDGDWVIVFNGCIYTSGELRSDLIDKGHMFYSSSDTEVIVEGFSAYGPNIVNVLMECFQLQHGTRMKKNSTFYVIDMNVNHYTIGLMEKPSYSHQRSKVLSNIQTIKSTLNLDALNEYFTFQNIFLFHLI